MVIGSDTKLLKHGMPVQDHIGLGEKNYHIGVNQCFLFSAMRKVLAQGWNPRVYACFITWKGKRG